MAVAPLLIAASRPVRLQPSSPWDVDYAADSCRLIRVFGDASNPVKLVFESTAPGEMNMLAAGKPLRTFEDKVPARFLPVESKPFAGTAADSTMGAVVLWPSIPMLPPATIAKLLQKRDELRRNPGVRPPPVSLEEQASYRTQRQDFAAATTEIEIDANWDHPVVLETGSLGPAIAAFDKCSRDSLKDWGVDANIEDKIVRPAWALNATEWLSSTDYPDRLVILGKESQVTVRLLVDASGKVTKCTSLSHYDEDEFKRITCAAIIKRAKFEPAELEDGTKVGSYYTKDVVFRIAH